MNEKRVILVIEDEKTISNFICRALTANDYKAIPAFSGKEGLSLFFSHGPDLILLDLGLPDMDGMDILKEVSGLPQETPVIIISARDRESEKVKALDMGADDYIVKPFGVSELLARIRTTLRRSDRLKLSPGLPEGCVPHQGSDRGHRQAPGAAGRGGDPLHPERVQDSGASVHPCGQGSHL